MINNEVKNTIDKTLLQQYDPVLYSIDSWKCFMMGEFK